jgi:hypothetical protein
MNWQGIQQFEYRWQPSKDLSLIAGSVPFEEIRPWRDRITRWVRHRAIDAPTESVRYEMFADGMAALAWRQRTAQALEPGTGSESRPEVSRVLLGPVDLLTPEVAMVICHTGLPEAIGPLPGKVAVADPLPPVHPDVLTGLMRSHSTTLDQLALGETGLSRVIAAALGDCDTALSVQLPQRVIERRPQEGAQGPLLWGLRRTVWPLLGRDSGTRGWSFSTYELPLGDMDTGALADIVFRAQQTVQPSLNTRREIVVRPLDPAAPPTHMHQGFAKLLVAAYQHMGGENLSQYLAAISDDYGAVDKRIEGVRASLLAALPAAALPAAGGFAAQPAPPDEGQAAAPSGDAVHTDLPGDAVPAEDAAGGFLGVEMPDQAPLPEDATRPAAGPAEPEHAAPQPLRHAAPTGRHAALTPPETPLPDTPPGTAPACAPVRGTSLPDAPPRGLGSPDPQLDSPAKDGEDAPPLQIGLDRQDVTAARQNYTIVDILNRLWTDRQDQEFEAAVHSLLSQEFTYQPDERTEARWMIERNQWYLPALEIYDGADPSELLQAMFRATVIPDLGKAEVAQQLAEWAETRKAPPEVIKALNAAAQGQGGAPGRMSQALERPLGRRWMTENGIRARSPGYSDQVSGRHGADVYKPDDYRPPQTFLQGKRPSDPVALLTVFCLVLIVLLVLALTR